MPKFAYHAKKTPEEIAQVKRLSVSMEEELQTCYDRWGYLDQFRK